MSFQPTFALTDVSRDNQSFSIEDTTPTNDTNGYGSPNAPANVLAITSVFAQVQPYGQAPYNSIGGTGGMSTGLTFSIDINDGVARFIVLYGTVETMTFTIDPDGQTLRTSDPDVLDKLDNVGAITLNGSGFPAFLSTNVDGTYHLSIPLTPGTYNTLYKYWIASTTGMVLNNGEGMIINAISQLPLDVDKCTKADNIFINICLKIGAEVAFNCGNNAKANEAALLLSGNKPNATVSPCPTCS